MLLKQHIKTWAPDNTLQPSTPSIHQFRKWLFFQMSRPKNFSAFTAVSFKPHICLVSKIYQFYFHLLRIWHLITSSMSSGHRFAQTTLHIFLTSSLLLSLLTMIQQHGPPCWFSKTRCTPHLYLRLSHCWHTLLDLWLAPSLTFESFESSLKNQLFSKTSTLYQKIQQFHSQYVMLLLCFIFFILLFITNILYIITIYHVCFLSYSIECKLHWGTWKVFAKCSLMNEWTSTQIKILQLLWNISHMQKLSYHIW